MAYASPRGIRRRMKLDDVRKPRQLRAFAKHRDDLAILKSKDAITFNGFGFLDMIKRSFGVNPETIKE